MSSVVIAVDTFLGSSEHWFNNVISNKHFPSEASSLYCQFIANIKHEKLEDYVVPLRIDSLNAAELIRSQEIAPTLIHLDGGHDLLSVSADLHAWWPILAPGGMLIGDDYYDDGTWPMVRRAFEQFFGDRDLLPLEYDGGKCRVRKPL